MKYAFVVPANTTATVMQAADSSALEPVKRTYPDAVYEKGRIVFSVGSGR